MRKLKFTSLEEMMEEENFTPEKLTKMQQNVEEVQKKHGD